MVEPYDWTYTTDFRGAVTGGLKTVDSTERIDLDKLKVREEIKFYSEIYLYEDELDDNGCTRCVAKVVRVRVIVRVRVTVTVRLRVTVRVRVTVTVRVRVTDSNSKSKSDSDSKSKSNSDSNSKSKSDSNSNSKIKSNSKRYKKIIIIIK